MTKLTVAVVQAAPIPLDFQAGIDKALVRLVSRERLTPDEATAALARIVRARTLIVRQELYVDASRCFGAPAWHILWKHVLPNALQSDPPLKQVVSRTIEAGLRGNQAA